MGPLPRPIFWEFPMSSPGKKTAKRKPSSDIDRSTLRRLEQLPNVGPAVARYLRRAGVEQPADLADRDPYALFEELCRLTGTRLDPCLLDTIISAVRFMGGEEARPWWAYTAERKRGLAARRRETGGEGRP
jgi:Pathogenicity locus